MNVILLHSTPLWVCSTAIRKCWASEGKSDTTSNMKEGYILCLQEDEHKNWYPEIEIQSEAGDADKELINRIGNKYKHGSTLEHLNYSFDIDGISRACLQELARHRHASLSVKSTRYTLKELKDLEENDVGMVPIYEFEKFLVPSGNPVVDGASINALIQLREILRSGTSNDVTKYCLPEAYKTSLVWTINARSLQNFLSLRSDKSALWEIRELAHNIYDEIPEEHKYLFEDFIKNKG